MGPHQRLPLQIRVVLEVMAIKEYYTFPKAPGLEPYRYIVFIVIPGYSLGRCPWCNHYRRRKLTRRHEFKSRLIAFHIALIPLGKV